MSNAFTLLMPYLTMLPIAQTVAHCVEEWSGW
jgi:hypothetical protein